VLNGRIDPGKVFDLTLPLDEVADLNAAAARMGVHGNRYNDRHMSLVGR
jgi:hypothetical protein